MSSTATEDISLETDETNPEPPRLEQITTHLERLRADLASYGPDSHQAQEQLARATAAGATEPELKKLRAAAASLSIRVREIESAIRFLEADQQIEAQRAGKAAIATARSLMVTAQSEFVGAVKALEAETLELARSLLPTYQRYTAALGACYEAQGNYARTVGNDRIYDRASAKDLPSALSQEQGEVLWPVVHSLATLAGERISGRRVMMEFKGN